MKKPTFKQIGMTVIVASLLGSGVLLASARSRANAVGGAQNKVAQVDPARQRATLTVTTVKPQAADWPLLLAANGNIAAWQEAIIGSEMGGMRLAEVSVNVGDVVQRGQVLARFTSESIAADVAQQEAAVEEARAGLAEAEANANRARTLSSSGMLSKQQTTQYITAEASTKARLQYALARLQVDRIRLRKANLIAPDDGVISSRSAAVGMVAPQGQELFKLIRKNRLEWRAEVTSTDLLRINPGQTVRVLGANGAKVEGTVRMIAPTVNPVTRNVTVYVDLPHAEEVHAGMFATGQFVLGHASVLAVPQSAVVSRDGYNYVYQVAANNRVAQMRITVGRRLGDKVEVVAGMAPDSILAGQGAGFLVDRDIVNVVAAPATSPIAVN